MRSGGSSTRRDRERLYLHGHVGLAQPSVRRLRSRSLLRQAILQERPPRPLEQAALCLMPSCAKARPSVNCALDTFSPTTGVWRPLPHPAVPSPALVEPTDHGL